MINFDKKISD